MTDELLQVTDLRTDFRIGGRQTPVVRGVTFSVRPGETVGLVGESGSGKSVTALSIVGLLPDPPARIAGGSVLLEGEELVGRPEKFLRSVRGARIAMVFQDPFSSLNPTMTLGEQIAEPIRLHKGLGRSAAKQEVLRLLHAVRIPSPETRFRQYPHEVSGGQRQRVMIAIAFACNPALLIADEPTTALDVTVQAQVLGLMADLQKSTGTGILLITHDFGVVAQVCDRVLVMYAGQIVESGTTEQIFRAPRHPYTQGLLASLPRADAKKTDRLPSMSGQAPSVTQLPPGCPFYERCPHAMPQICPTREPESFETEPGHTVRCYLYDPSVNLPLKKEA